VLIWLSACSRYSDPKLIGKWKMDCINITIEFKKDGTCILSKLEGTELFRVPLEIRDEPYKMTYTLRKDNGLTWLSLHYENIIFDYVYRFVNDELEFILIVNNKDDSDRHIFVRIE